MSQDLAASTEGLPGAPGHVLAALVDGITVHDAEGRYLWVSPSFTPLLDVTAEDVVGDDPFTLELFHPDDVERVIEVQSEALSSGEPWRVTYRLRRSDDQYVWVESTGRVLQLRDHDCFVVSTRPVDAADVDDVAGIATGARSLLRS